MVLLEKLIEIATKGASRPMVLWLDYFYEKSAILLPELEEIFGTLDEKSDVRSKLGDFIALLKQDQPDELDFAKSLSYISEIFSEEKNGPQAALINEYVQQVIKFYNQAEMDAFYRRKRALLKDKKTEAEEMEYDKKLFAHEGMLYCLEYYLVMYKAIADAPNEKDQKKYITSTEINMGFGNVPGLWIDFSRDEVLGKFIYSILNDDIRNRLACAYFDTKEVFGRIKVSCDKKNQCTYDFSETDVKSIIDEFKNFIQILLNTFKEVGIENLSSFFFTPYGNKAKISEIKL